ncbi:MAG: protein kinase [Kofleriaceae bacterium]
MQLEIPDAQRDSHPSLATGTGDEPRTRVESPSARNNPPSRERDSSRPPPIPARAADDPDIRIGQTFGTYRLHELLGKGGMGYVYRAEHTKLGREVALKLLRADYARRRDAVNRFFQEAKTVNRVRHRNIVDVTDFVELDDGTTFIIMELLRGTSLGKWARLGVDLPRALAVFVQICDGLGAAHAVGVIHRDLKPDNIIIVPTNDGAELVKLLDFGVAKLVNRDDEDVGFQTQAGSVIGTPAYMSPEQAGGMPIDQRSDIYSLGAIMYELFCGQPLFRGRSFGEYVRKHLTEAPVAPHLTQGGSNIHPQLEQLIMRCLAKEPNDRFAHIVELRDGLLHLLSGVETHPGANSGIVSGVHPPSAVHRALSSAPQQPPTLIAASQLPPHVLPLPAPHLTTQPTPQPSYGYAPPAHQTGQSGLQSQVSYGYAPQSTVHRSTTWVWLLAGAVAVGIGITLAMVYVSSKKKEPVAVETPVTQPQVMHVEPAPPPPVTPVAKHVELRFDSLPSGGVYAEGHSAELCRTPCAFDVDLGDGEAQDKRNFVVKSEGYVDKVIAVDFTGAQREFHIQMERVAAAQTVQTPVTTATKKKTVTKKTTTAAKPDDSDDDDNKPVEKPVAKTVDSPVEKVEKKGPTIDPTDTHDPFKKHK